MEKKCRKKILTKLENSIFIETEKCVYIKTSIFRLTTQLSNPLWAFFVLFNRDAPKYMKKVNCFIKRMIPLGLIQFIGSITLNNAFTLEEKKNIHTTHKIKKNLKEKNQIQQTIVKS